MTSVPKAPRNTPMELPQPDPPAASDLATLIRTHQGMVWRYLRLCGADVHEADDLLQDTFLAFFTRHSQSDELACPAAFLRGIARHLLLASRRRARRAPPTADWLAAVDQLAAADPHAFLDTRLPALQDCLGRLSDRARQALEWHHVEGVPRREVGARLGLGDEGAKSLLERTRDLLRDCVRRRLGLESQP